MKSGFTLVEVMVAVAVASLLVLGVTASTQATLRTAERQQSDARRAEERARAVELVRQDWRGSLRAIRPPVSPPAGVRVFQLTTSADSLVPSGGRGVRLATYTASEKGLTRSEGGSEVLLIPGPVVLEYWDGVGWRPELEGRPQAIRLQVRDPDEQILVR
ncbi:MAG TPA: prepilin-type N-terminal cleavage/methylation domain-containing protein [Planctomycetota bacterium]|nr:prepilin-type N-terminal cleavage/methylation domain-containing protein [Planctomycetota bacterium]